MIALCEGMTAKCDQIDLTQDVLTSETNLTHPKDDSDIARVIAVADGHPVYADAAKNLNKEDFDIILDIPQQMLWVRQNPEAKGKLFKCYIEGMRARRRRLLVYILEHPAVIVSRHNICKIYRDKEPVSPNTLSQTMYNLRQLLGQKKAKGPYILTKPVWVSHRRMEQVYGSGYVMNDKFRYLVILEKF